MADPPGPSHTTPHTPPHTHPRVTPGEGRGRGFPSHFTSILGGFPFPLQGKGKEQIPLSHADRVGGFKPRLCGFPWTLGAKVGSPHHCHSEQCYREPWLTVASLTMAGLALARLKNPPTLSACERGISLSLGGGRKILPKWM